MGGLSTTRPPTAAPHGRACARWEHDATPLHRDEGSPRLVTRREALAAGWTDQDLRRSADIYRVIRGVYAPVPVP
ncbi:hypothetical protein GCM10027174_11170 [Salinifilum aidingensis]